MADFWKQAGKIVGTVAPTIATALGGPLAGMAVKAIAGALGLPESTPEDQVAAAISNATPADLLALKKADQEFQVRMRELDIDIDRIAAGDRDSARQREASTGDSWTPRVLAAVVVGGFLATVYMVLAGRVDGMKDPLIATTVGTLIGYVSAKADQVISYYFGSSASSKAKDDTIKRAVASK